MTRGARVRGLYAIADTRYLDDTQLTTAVEQALAGGAGVIQYRDKTAAHEVRQRQARALAALCRSHQALFIVNDDVDLARRVNADGVHLGRDDAPVLQARRALGDEAVIGVSCYNELARAEHAAAHGADYVAFGSFFASRTKPNAVRAPLDLLHTARAALAVPIVAIGGITPDNAGELIHAGASAIAVIEGVFAQADARAAAARYARLFEQIA